MWFFLLGIIAALIGRFTEKETIEAFIDGAKDMLSVVLIIVVARGASVLMSKTYLDSFILDKAAGLLQGLSPVLFVIGAFVLYLGLSFLIPSTSGLAYVSIPVMGALAKNIGCCNGWFGNFQSSICHLDKIHGQTNDCLRLN